ncbi:hypothetical protein OHT61_31065 [Streptomyces sp. NBC_00178]|nr:hypothetical protein [Streptomyces sp. NBC_00178]
MTGDVFVAMIVTVQTGDVFAAFRTMPFAEAEMPREEGSPQQ